MNRTAGLILSGLLAIGVAYANGATGEEEHDPAALAQAMQRAKATLETGLKASEREGKPISTKFEVEDNALQLSVYTLKGNDAMEVVEDPQTGAIVKSEKITEDDDLQDAQEQKAAMATAKTSLLAATETAVKENSGSRAVSVFPQLQKSRCCRERTSRKWLRSWTETHWFHDARHGSHLPFSDRSALAGERTKHSNGGGTGWGDDPEAGPVMQYTLMTHRPEASKGPMYSDQS